MNNERIALKSASDATIDGASLTTAELLRFIDAMVTIPDDSNVRIPLSTFMTEAAKKLRRHRSKSKR